MPLKTPHQMFKTQFPQKQTCMTPAIVPFAGQVSSQIVLFNTHAKPKNLSNTHHKQQHVCIILLSIPKVVGSYPFLSLVAHGATCHPQQSSNKTGYLCAYLQFNLSRKWVGWLIGWLVGWPLIPSDTPESKNMLSQRWVRDPHLNLWSLWHSVVSQYERV